jgi:hypothetical protein
VSEVSTSWGDATGSVRTTRDAQVLWEQNIAGVASDFVLDGDAVRVLAYRRGVTTLWQLDSGSPPVATWASRALGPDARLLRRDDGTLRVVGPSPGGITLGDVGDSLTFVALEGLEAPSVTGAALAGDDGLWVSVVDSPSRPGEMIHLSTAGVVLSRQTLRSDHWVTGMVGTRSGAMVYGNSRDDGGWASCLPDTPTAAGSPMHFDFLAITGGWTENGRARLGLDAGVLGCVAEPECDEPGEMKEVSMPMPQSKQGRWLYGRAGTLVMFGFDTDQEAFGYDVGEAGVVDFEGTDSGEAYILLRDGARSRMVVVGH